ncbi:predicted protein [Nematostella vectensis]|uniref:BUB1 N-terminal domain-containing protein n=1 Tax=Nematostella vectensis TaxID=45351 RepID=A7RIT6_NEMVE|nr:predicted protein [Nematostella vectensis]|eukprot:XP_001640519.1 predicted protein [Nematostella vectensis]
MSAETNLSNSTEWELSKENVQPLKSGRKVANLTAALAPSSCDYQSKISREKQLFETEIRTYEGDDPLQVWYSYIVWICENFPTGCRDQSTLLERCISLFKDVDKYKHDERYLKIWIQYADLCTDPIDVYDYMHSQSMFSKLAKLYESWAYNLERQGNYKKADEVYTLGINRGAQPMEVLTRQHKAFERRLSEFISTNDSPDDINQENDPQRVALGGLKKHGKKGTVGAQRTGHGVTSE